MIVKKEFHVKTFFRVNLPQRKRVSQIGTDYLALPASVGEFVDREEAEP
jgi:hypothetical protein